MKSIGFYVMSFLLIALIASVGLNVYYYTKDKPLIQKQTNNSITPTETRQIKMRVDSFGSVHASFQVKAPESRKQFNNEKQPNWADTAMRALDVGSRYKDQVQELTRVNITLQDSLLKAKVRYNDAKEKVFYYKGKYIALTFKPIHDTTDTAGVFSYHYNADFTASNIIKRGMFGMFKKSIIDISSKDKNFTINNMEHFQVDQKDPFVRFKFQAAAKYNVLFGNFEPGADATFDFGNATLGAGYYYNFRRQHNEILLELKKTLISF